MVGLSMQPNTIYCGHVLDILRQFPDKCVDTVVTSPPYFGLRNYGDETTTIWDGEPTCSHDWGDAIPLLKTGGTNSEMLHKKNSDNFQMFEASSCFCIKCNAWKGQLGHEPTLSLYIDHLLQITAELRRILKRSGTMFWNHGDCYGGSGRGWVGYGSEVVSPNKGNRGAVDQMRQPGPHINLPPKCLAMQSERLMIRMVDEQKFVLRNRIVWIRENDMPDSANDRFTNKYENIYMLAKTTNNWFDMDAVLEPYTSPLDRWGGPRLIADGVSLWDEKTKQHTYRNRNMRPNSEGRHPIDVWFINTVPGKTEHCAAFPLELAEKCIKCSCPPKVCSMCGKPWMEEHTSCIHNIDTVPGVVLDPFAGSGTTLIAAKQLGRCFIGIELNPKYAKIAENRVTDTAEQLELPGAGIR